LADRVAAEPNGTVIFHFTARPGVCGDGETFIRTGHSSYYGSFSTERRMEPCMLGPVQVRLTLEDGAVNRVQYWVGPLRSREARDLGAVPAPEAARYLMTIARRGTPRASAKAIFPAVLADSAVVWPELLAIAKDTDTRSRATRMEAMLFLSRFASGTVAGHPNQPFEDDDEDVSEDESLKVHAVFVLSQLRNGEGIPDLLQIARTNPDRRVRSQALFWLGQSGDPRALALFESLLRS
jgi:HEAT repeat protein